MGSMGSPSQLYGRMVLVLASLVTAALSSPLVSTDPVAPGAVRHASQDNNIQSLAALRPRTKKWHLEPLGVTKLKRDRLAAPHSVSQTREFHQTLSSVDGDTQGRVEENEQVEQNGKLVSSIYHKERQNQVAGEKPRVEAMTKVDIPDQNIHETIVDNSDDSLRAMKRNSMEAEDSILDLEAAAELAGYILDTGDEGTVVTFLEELLNERKVTEEEALVFVEVVKELIEETRVANLPDSENDHRRNVSPLRDILLERKIEEEREKEFLDEEANEEFLRGVLSQKQTKTDEETDQLMNINAYLEAARKKGRISESLYTQMKEAVIESLIDNIREA